MSSMIVFGTTPSLSPTRLTALLHDLVQEPEAGAQLYVP